MQMLGGFSVLRLSGMMGMMNVNFTKEELSFWKEVRNTHAAINGRRVRDYTEKQMLTWYNKLWTDSAEYKMMF